MTRSIHKRFVIALPKHLAAQINTVCEEGGFNSSDFFCEAAHAYLAAKSRAQQSLGLKNENDLIDDPLCIFGELGSRADRVYDTLR